MSRRQAQGVAAAQRPLYRLLNGQAKERCNVKWICMVTIGLLAITGCSSLVATAPSPGYASLEFADARRAKDSIPGTFQSVGGLDIPTTSSTIYVKAGWRRIGYTCPDHLTVDGPPTTTAVFEAGASYQLTCVGSEADIRRVGEGSRK